MAITRKSPIKTPAKPAVTKGVSTKAAQPKSGNKDAAPIKKGFPAKKASGTAPARKPTPKFFFKAPKDFKNCMVQLDFATDKDGFMAPGPEVQLILGNPDTDRAKFYDMLEHDPATVAVLLARFSMMLYAPNVLRRFAPKTEYSVMLRVGVSRKDNTLRVTNRGVWRTNAKGKLVQIEDKKDPELRKLRRGTKFLAGSFSKLTMTGTFLKEYDKEQRTQEREAARDAARAEKAAAKSKVSATAKAKAGRAK